MCIKYGNPFFPAYNNIFRSDSAAISSFADVRFLPHSFFDMMSYPLKIAIGRHPTAELSFTEPRFALFAILCVVFMFICVVRAIRPASGQDLPPNRLGLMQINAFLVVTVSIWLDVFAIERYAVAYEIIAGIAIIATLPHLVAKRYLLPATCAMVGLTLSLTHPPDWWHRSWSAPFETNLPAMLNQDATYIMVDVPLGYWASRLSAGSRFITASYFPIGLGTGGALGIQLKDDVLRPPGGSIRVLGFDMPMSKTARDGLSRLGVVPAPPCLRLRSMWWIDSIICNASHIGGRPHAAADITLGRPVDFGFRGDGWIYLGDGWSNAGETGITMTSQNAELIFHVNRNSAKVLDLSLAGSSSSLSQRSSFRVDENQSHELVMNGTTHRRFCLPAASRYADGVTSFMVEDRIRHGTGYGTPLILQGMTVRDALSSECGSSAP